MKSDIVWQRRIDHYLAVKRLGHDSRLNYKRVLNKYLRWSVCHGLAPEQVSASDFVDYVEHLRSGPRKSATVTFHIQVIKGFYDWLLHEEHISFHPASRIPSVYREPSTRDTLSLEELTALWHAAVTPLDRAVVGLLGINSLRTNELTKALVADISEIDNHKVLRLPLRSGVHSSLPYTVLDPQIYEALQEMAQGRRTGPLLVRNGAAVSRKTQANIVTKLGRVAGIEFRITPLTLTFSMRAIAIEKGFSYVGVVRSAGDLETRRLAKWMARASTSIADHAALRMARLVIGTGHASQDRIMQARVMLEQSDAPAGLAAAFAGAVLERHLRSLTSEFKIPVTSTNPKIGSYSSALSARGIISPSDVQLIARIQGYRDSAAHGWFESVTESNARWVINEVGELLRKFPLRDES